MPGKPVSLGIACNEILGFWWVSTRGMHIARECMVSWVDFCAWQHTFFPYGPKPRQYPGHNSHPRRRHRKPSERWWPGSYPGSAGVPALPFYTSRTLFWVSKLSLLLNWIWWPLFCGACVQGCERGIIEFHWPRMGSSTCPKRRNRPINEFMEKVAIRNG